MRILFTLLISTIIPSFAFSQHWEKEAIIPLPEGITNNAVAAGSINGQNYIYTFGGLDSTKLFSGIHRRCYRFPIGGQAWERIDDLPDTLGSIASSANRIDDIIYIIGGYHVFAGGNEKSSNRVHRYDILNNQFLDDGAPIPVPIDDQVQAVWRDSLIFVVTGWSESQNVPNVQIYNPSSNTWMAGTSLPNGSYPAFGATGEIIGDTIFYFGGARSTPGFPISSLYRKGVIDPNNPSQIEWSVALTPDSRVGYRPGAAVSGGNMYWIGGSEQTYNFNGLAYSNNRGVPPSNRSLRFNPSTQVWDEDRSITLPMDLRNVAQTSDSIIYLIGGMTRNQTVSREVLRLKAFEISTSNNNISVNNTTLKVFPNPSDHLIQISLADPSIEAIQLSIFSADGKLQHFNNTNTNNWTVNCESWTKGIYILEVRNNKRIWREKLIIK